MPVKIYGQKASLRSVKRVSKKKKPRYFYLFIYLFILSLDAMVML